MTKEEWIGGAFQLLRVGWPSRNDDEPDHDAYVFLLRRFTAREVEEALEAMVGVRQYPPKAGEIAAQVLAMRPAATPQDVPPVNASIQAKRDWMLEFDRLETERRDAELDEWWDAHPECHSWGAGILRKLGLESGATLVGEVGERDFAA